MKKFSWLSSFLLPPITFTVQPSRLAIATEHLPDDQYHVGQIVYQAWDGYRKTCGPCMPEGNSIRPEVGYFQ